MTMGSFLVLRRMQKEVGRMGSNVVNDGGNRIGSRIGSRSMVKANKMLQTQKRRLFQIAAMTGACLLLSMGATLATSAKMDEWVRTSTLWLDCKAEYGLASLFRDYTLLDGFDRENARTVCPLESITYKIGNIECVTGCIWDPSVTEETLQCQPGKGYLGVERPAVPCTCSCEDLITVERPSVGTMLVSYIAQNLVVCIVAINMGFRAENLAVWKKSMIRGLSKLRHSSTAVGVAKAGHSSSDSNSVEERGTYD
jgi:hypothetical protein